MDQNITNKPLVSVLMPAYNAEKYIHFAIESILNQTYTNFELIIIDDGSKDKTVDIIKSFQDIRIQFHQNEKNIGIIETLNKAIDLSKGEYIARMDADDVSQNDRLILQLEEFNNNNNLILCGTWYKLLYNNHLLHTVKLPSNNKEIKAKLVFNNPICHPSVMIKSTIIKKYKYNSKHIGCEDYGLWVEIKDEGDFVNISIPLINYRVHNTNVSLQKNDKKEDVILQIVSENIYQKYKYSMHKSFLIKKDIYNILKLIQSKETNNYEKNEFINLLNSKNIPLKQLSLLFKPEILIPFIHSKYFNLIYKIKTALIERNIFYS